MVSLVELLLVEVEDPAVLVPNVKPPAAAGLSVVEEPVEAPKIKPVVPVGADGAADSD